MLTADTYTSVLPESQREAAEATARLVLDAAKSGEIRRQLSHTRDEHASAPDPAPARVRRAPWKPSSATCRGKVRSAHRRSDRTREAR